MINIFDKIKNKSNPKEYTGSVFNHLQQSSSLNDYYINIVLSRLIKSSLSTLNNEKIFKELYKDNLVTFLSSMLRTGSLKCYLYRDKKGIYKRMSSKSIKEILTNYTEIVIDINNIDTNLYNQIRAISLVLSNLVEVSLQTSELSTKLLFKGDGLRNRVSSDQATPIADLVALTSSQSNVLVIDGKDTIENGIPSNSSKTILKENFDLAVSTLSATTGFPVSFFSGDFGGGIASTSNIENTRLFEAKEQFFSTYLSAFFLYLSEEIEPKMTLSDRYSLNEIQSFLIAFEDKIDVEETLLNAGFTLRKNNDKSTNTAQQTESKKQNIPIRNI